jgi:CDP-diacylglycerol--serine O-phosphatidyltransferase
LMLIVAWPQAMLFVTFAGYALSGPIARVWTMLTKTTGKQIAKTNTPVVDSRE